MTACLIGLGIVAPPPAGAATSASTTETRPFEPGEDDAGGVLTPPRSNAPSRVPAAGLPRPVGRVVVTDAAAKRAEGLSLRDTRDANGGNQFSLEPPDQALCVGGTEVIEGVNNVFATYSTSGARTSAPQAYTPFWNDGVAEVDRTTGTYGPFVSDPKCYFDPVLHRFFMTELQLGTNPTTGDFTGDSYENIAVSRTATPGTSAADWYLYRIDVRNDGTHGTPSHAGCPCLGDQPLIGADTYGFYVTTNEFSIDGPEFNGAQIYAFDKAALAAGTLRYQRIETNGTPLAEGTAYSVQPATSPVAADWSTANNGTEYALSALDFTATLDDRIAAWALTNTRSLTTDHPAVTVSRTVIGSEVYGQPPSVQQKSGPYPLGQSLKDKLNLLQSNDDRMNQVVYAGGKLWSGVNTAAKTENGPTTTAIAYFVVRPTATPTSVSATMAHQGYVSVNRNSVMYPSIGVAPGGTRAAMVFTLAGPGYHPSTAYVRLSSSGAPTGPVSIYGAGTKPADGFTGYPQYGGNGQERWGDYSAAVADPGGTVWVAAEYVPGTFGYPPYLANWGTAIGAIG
ncbi:hypothetical protein GCM10011594_29080 [Nakamurella endophytica]|uniref:DUF839 domain-containing protein n=1 Tax=Nakamurella endophytica TaxID=1748367 RepID=A0A917T1T2_9ACTN|nr:hypothetical protein GCM10011594_29080 [Nakamurella endophytica]